MRSLEELRDLLGREEVTEVITLCVDDAIHEAVAAYESRDKLRADPTRLGKDLLDAIASAQANLDDIAEKLYPSDRYSPEDEGYERRRQREVDDEHSLGRAA